MKVDPNLAARLIEQEDLFGPRADRLLDRVFSRGDGVFLWDTDGNRHMDFQAGDGAVNQGHSHSRIAAAMVEQCLRLALPSPSLRNDRRPVFLERLCAYAGMESALPMNSGSEAVETALAAARGWAWRQKDLPPAQGQVVAFQGHDHGHGVEAQVDDRANPGGGGFVFADFGDVTAAEAEVGPHTFAVLVEPIQWRSGVRVPPRGFLRGLRELCDRKGLLLIVDEIRSGLGRTGKRFAFEHEGIRPDVLLVGKSLTGGLYPASAVLASRMVLDSLPPGTPRSTFAGNPLACAVGFAALAVLEEERLVDRAAELGAYFLARLRAMEGTAIKEVRGMGLWAGIALTADLAVPLARALAREGLLCEPLGDDVLGLSPPLVINREQLDWALERLERVLA